MAELHPGLRSYVERARAALPAERVPLGELRAGVLAETPGLVGVPDAVDDVSDAVVPAPDGDIPVRVYRPRSDEPLPVLVWFHGGGWVVGDLDSHDALCRALAHRGPCVVVSVGYRLAPEHPFPAGLDDARAATRWVVDRSRELGADPARIAVGGDSAGGNLAAAVALGARRDGLPIALQVLVYPVTDHELESDSYQRLGTSLNLTRAKMAWYWAQYLGAADGSQPDASPLRAGDLAGLPPALVLTAEHDVLVAEGEAYAARLREAGVAVSHTRYDGMIHGFIRMPALVDDADRAVAEIAAALRALPRGA